MRRHEWKQYIGLTEQFNYCEHCDIRSTNAESPFCEVIVTSGDSASKQADEVFYGLGAHVLQSGIAIGLSNQNAGDPNGGQHGNQAGPGLGTVAHSLPDGTTISLKVAELRKYPGAWVHQNSNGSWESTYRELSDGTWQVTTTDRSCGRIHSILTISPDND